MGGSRQNKNRRNKYTGNMVFEKTASGIPAVLRDGRCLSAVESCLVSDLEGGYDESIYSSWYKEAG